MGRHKVLTLREMNIPKSMIPNKYTAAIIRNLLRRAPRTGNHWVLKDYLDRANMSYNHTFTSFASEYDGDPVLLVDPDRYHIQDGIAKRKGRGMANPIMFESGLSNEGFILDMVKPKESLINIDETTLLTLLGGDFIPDYSQRVSEKREEENK